MLVLAVAGGAAYLLLRDPHHVALRPAAAPHHCPSPTPAATPVLAALPAPSQVRLALLNGTSRNGLAKSVGEELARRGFVVTEKSNAPAALAGPTEVAWGPGAEQAAELVVSHIVGAVALRTPTAPAGTVRVTLGNAFVRLATPAEAAASPRPTPRPSARPVSVFPCHGD